ncbi:TVP38/TMEM64 family protein [Streptococcus cuniculipharyngis]|uniref:TVP38/TMEM64 family membrane protein n=1 Tax=Streptococcus cuniculipharyngis TaxID=1562651 RepID=A0A5C5S9Z1_9STRE|nr:TVP38/TMEM64 family protein [Streptococcus cuniculipharyngis]TWS96898.1 TVP38/TMEM64 family protein [Streptococcus cuniculipharyngis]
MYKVWQKTFQILGIITLIASIALVIWLFKNGILNDQNAFKSWVSQYQLMAPLIFIFIQIVQIVIPILPGGVTTVAGYLVFGPWLGFITNYIGILLGSIILFLIVKRYGRPFIKLFVKDKDLSKYEAKLETKGYERFFIFCMASPISPADIMVMVTGLSSMSLRRFIIIMLITKPLSIIGYSYLWIYGGHLLQYFLSL